jgi:ubiquinone/menaquinone biosynthesis C-methylase UbiE
MNGQPIDAGAFTAWEAEGWEVRAGSYHRIFAPLTSRFIPALLDLAGVGTGSRVLDIACGPGYAAAAAVARGATATGVDIAAAMVELAGRLHPQVTFVEVNAEELPFDDGSYDAVVGNLAILHMGRPEEAVREFARVLAPGGRLALSTWDSPGVSRMPGIFFQAIQEAGAAPPPDVPPGPPFFRFADEAEFTAVLEQAGLVDVGVETLAMREVLPGAGALWDWLLEATVRAGAVVRAQPPDVQRQVRDNLDRIAAGYADGTGALDLPVSIKIGHGRSRADM